MDNSATSFPKPEGVLEEATEFYKNFGVNVGRGTGTLEQTAFELFSETRSLCADQFNRSYPETIIFSPSATYALNQVILGSSRKNFNYYFTPFEHNSVLRPLNHLSRTNAAKLHEIPISSGFDLNFDKLEMMFSENEPDVLTITQTSNVTGYMPPIKEISTLAKEYNPEAIIIVDGAQSAGSVSLDMEGNGIDFYVFSGHKSLFSGFGIAGWILRTEDLSDKINIVFAGGTGTESEKLEMPSTLPSRYEIGSHNIWALASLNYSLKWINNQNKADLVNLPLTYANKLFTELQENDRIQFYKPEKTSWYPILSLTIRGKSPQEIANQLSQLGISTRSGLHCAPLTHKLLGTFDFGGTIRLSPGFFNQDSEIPAVVKEIENLTRK
ncbi:MAG: aminotransferase class V-fold PLP-dependent enzyme [Candidatus Heimdallarchaeota archaeon]|nr:aminotransferase class V-fold PLP-dependent enzyme [Candidatus Heimdallarchaeota archaeon]